MRNRLFLLLMSAALLFGLTACPGNSGNGDISDFTESELPDEDGDLSEEDGDLSQEDGDVAQEDGDLSSEDGDLTQEDGDVSPDVPEDEVIIDPPDWPDGVTLIELDGAGHALVDATFEGGETFDDMSWARADGVNCWAQPTMDEFYHANHKAFALSELLEGWYDVTLTLTPSGNNMETNPYIVQMGPNQRDAAPFDVPVGYCHSPVQLPGPGAEVTTTLRLYAGSHNVFIGVANRDRWNADDNGAFTLEVQATPVVEECYADLEKPGKWAPHVSLVALDGEGEAVFQDSLAKGAQVCSLDFLESAYCVPETQFDYYKANHRFYAIDGGVPEQTYMTITVTPDPGVDINIYGSFQGEGNYYVPPNYPIQNCDTSLVPATPNPDGPQPSIFTNPGESESISFWSSNHDYEYFFAVSGPDGLPADEGTYIVSIDTVSTQTNFCDPEDYEAVSGLSSWPSSVTQISVDGAGHGQAFGDLNNGVAPCTLDWAANSSVACFPSPQFHHFAGNMEFFALSEPPPAGSMVTFEVYPDPGVDVNIFGYNTGTTSFMVPPHVPSVGACEASYPQTLSHEPNPSEVESISFYNPTGNQYNYFLGVATGEDNTLAGGYRVEVTVVEPPPPHCPESLPGSSYPTWPGIYDLISLDSEGHGESQGDLADGSCVNLGFASDSAVACFPATQNDHFEGNHVFHALAEPIPPRSEVTVRVIPDPGVEVNVYGFQSGVTNYPVPPYVPSAICEASFNPGGANPGEAEVLYFSNPSESNSYHISFAVAGDDATGTSGSYRIEVDMVEGQTHCEESLPGQSGLTDWPAEVNLITLDANDEWTGTGNLDQGACTNLDFADDSNVACFPATQFANYSGNHVFYALDEPMPPKSVLTINVMPRAGVDVSIYGLQTGTTNYYVPPYVPSGICEESMSYGGPNPGDLETIVFYNPSNSNSYNVLFGVAGGQMTPDAGNFDMSITMDVGVTHCEESLPGSSWDSWPTTVEMIDISTGSGGASGDLSQGKCLNLGWASNSSVACFPATMNSYYEGNHVFYALSSAVPPQKNIDITVTSTDGSDINYYAYEMGTNSYFVPPYVPGTVACEYVNPTNAGSTIHMETVNNPYNVFIGVAGPGVSGAFDIDVSITDR